VAKSVQLDHQPAHEDSALVGQLVGQSESGLPEALGAVVNRLDSDDGRRMDGARDGPIRVWTSSASHSRDRGDSARCCSPAVLLIQPAEGREADPAAANIELLGQIERHHGERRDMLPKRPDALGNDA